MILRCNQCAEMVVVLGREEDWYMEGYMDGYMEGYIFFECECGQRLTTATKLC
jgi:hypothetical protein